MEKKNQRRFVFAPNIFPSNRLLPPCSGRKCLSCTKAGFDDPLVLQLLHPLAFSTIFTMETEDPFSSFIIHGDQIENPPTINNILTHEKLQTRRKEKKHVDGSSNINGSRYKIIVKYDRYFKTINNGAKEKYYSGKQRTIYLEETSYSVEELLEEVSKFYLEDDTLKLSLLFIDKRVSSQSFIEIEDDSSYRLMLSMYEEEKKVIIYVTAEKITSLEDIVRVDESAGTNIDTWENKYPLVAVEDGSDYCHSEVIVV